MAERIIDLPTEKMATDLRFWLREEVVRCRDCKHFVTNIHGSYCKRSISTTSDPNGFCAWSSRKESE